MKNETARYNLGEIEFLNWEAREDAAGDDEPQDDREEWEAAIRAELWREIPAQAS